MKMKFRCITCDCKVEFDKSLKTVIGAVDLVAYAHSKSEHDFGTGSYGANQVHFVICDPCFTEKLETGNNMNAMIKEARGY
tara:strand:+ start:395 stop:637 length:243 start_codon:yes stop_codon:yes gene_type:complete